MVKWKFWKKLEKEDEGNMAGIDYGMGQTNIDRETGIRYGVIHQYKISSFAMEDIISDGVDKDFESFKDELVDAVKSAINSALDDYTRKEVDDEEVLDFLESMDAFEDYEGTGDCTKFDYKETNDKDEVILHLETCSDGDIFVIKSPFYTKCDFCSPCAPGAGYLTSTNEDGTKAYC
jgi:hypothetical protein